MSTLKVDNIRHNNATSDAITMASDGTCTGNITNRPNYNLIINGQFDVWQRATSSSSTNTSGYKSADRWRFEASGATYTTSQQVFDPGQTDVPSNPKYYLRFNVTTANDNTGITQRIEDVDSVQGEHTLSFWVKGTNPAGGSIQVIFTENFGSGGSTAVSGILGTFSLSSSWAKKTITFTPTSISGKTIGTSSYFQISIRQPSADDTTTAWALDLANVKLEAGSKATDYQRVGFGDELQRCKRYFQKIVDGSDDDDEVIGTAHAWNSVQAEIPLRWDVEMRAAPDLEQGVGTNYYQIIISGVNKYTNQFQTYNFTRRSGMLYNTNFSGLSGGGAYRAKINNASAYLHLDAEL